MKYYTVEELVQDPKLLASALGRVGAGYFGLIAISVLVEFIKIDLIPRHRLYEILKPLEKVSK